MIRKTSTSISCIPALAGLLGLYANQSFAQTAPAGDVVFCIDESASMGDEQAAIQSGVPALANAITSSGVDGQYCLIGYGDNNVSPMVEQTCTADQAVFANAVDGLVASGSTEPGYDCIVMATDATATGQRTDADLCLVIVTDEPSNGDANLEADAQTTLTNAGATLFGILEGDTTIASYENLINNTGGALFSFTELVDDPSSLAADLGAACAAAVIMGDDGNEGCPPKYWKKHGKGKNHGKHDHKWGGHYAHGINFTNYFKPFHHDLGKHKALMRHTEAAYKNARHEHVAYQYTEGEVYLILQEAKHTGDWKTALKQLKKANNAGCPLH